MSGCPMKKLWSKLRRGLPTPPDGMADLGINPQGYPIPFFVSREHTDTDPDFRVIDPMKIVRCLVDDVCWVCGKPFPSRMSPRTFVDGPFSVGSRVCVEPPSHEECAIFAVQACPFLSIPTAKRPTRPLPEGSQTIDRGKIEVSHENPGISCLWTTLPDRYYPSRQGNGVIFRMIAPPLDAVWYVEGRIATRHECDVALGRALATLTPEERRAASPKYIDGIQELFPRRGI